MTEDHNGVYESQLTPNQARLIELVLSGKSIVTSAKELKINESTARRWLKLPHVAAARTTARDGMYQEVLTSLKVQSLSTLKKHILADVDVTAGSQMRAVALVHEQLELKAKILEIEAKMAQVEMLLLQRSNGGYSS